MTKTVLVTGGNRGIGFAICEGLVKEGYKVLLGARDLGAGQAAAAEIGGDVTAVQLDVANKGSIQAVLADYASDIDVLVNNAGVLDRTPLLEDTKPFYENMQVMVEGPYELMAGILPHMMEKGYGRVVNVSSQWGSLAANLQGPGAYGIAKASLNALTLAISREVSGDVKVNCMCPGWVHTRMGGEQAPLTPEQGAETALWLAMLDADGPNGGFFQGKQAIGW